MKHFMNHFITPSIGLAVLASITCVSPTFATPLVINWKTIGNAGNPADTRMCENSTSQGAVNHAYNIGTYAVTNAQYVAFLNAKGASNDAEIFNPTMAATGTDGSNISQSGDRGSYTYNVESAYANLPVCGVTWYDAARFSNWLGNGQGAADMETGAYTLNGATDGIIMVNPGANVYIPSINEWYKAAYYNGANSTYSLYADGKDTLTPADANYLPAATGLVDVGYGTPSSYGVFGMGGNIYQWNDAVINGSARGIRGGCWSIDQANNLLFRHVGDSTPGNRFSGLGFRVASSVTTVVAQSNEWSYTISPDHTFITITGYTGDGGSVVIPASIENLPVTTIGDHALSYCATLKDVTIPDSVTTIGELAFNACSTLTSVTLGNGVTTIGYAGFFRCSALTSLTLGSGVTCIGGAAFQDCSALTSLTIPNGVTSIGDYAFINCSSLTSVTIPNSVISIGDGAFLNCIELPSVMLPESVSSFGNSEFQGCRNLKNVILLGAVQLPANTFTSNPAIQVQAYSQGQYDANWSAGRTSVINDPNHFNLYNPSQVQALNVGAPLLARDPATGKFKLTIKAKKSVDLKTFSDLPFVAEDSSINYNGEIEFQFTSPDNAAFFRLESHSN